MADNSPVITRQWPSRRDGRRSGPTVPPRRLSVVFPFSMAAYVALDDQDPTDG